MSEELGTYSFLPWLRLGIANQIAAADEDHGVKLRATVPVTLTLTGTAVDGGGDKVENPSRPVSLYGPGDIVGVERRAIVKVEPKSGFTNFEDNYLAHIEFYDEDFPWRYTPAAPDMPRHRLRPWLTLIVLKKEEFDEAGRPGPLDAIKLLAAPADAFPPADQLWAWAHVHVNQDIVKNGAEMKSADMANVQARLEGLLAANPDHAYSRIVCPRRLEADSWYEAFLVPTFESGRLAGLGAEPDLANAEYYATLSAWADYTGRDQTSLYPYYHRWRFKTGATGDFESLVRLLKPRPPDARLGRRDMDVLEPGSNIAGIDVPGLDGVLRLEGALKVPLEALDKDEEDELAKFEKWDDPPPHPFQSQLAQFINLAVAYEKAEPGAANQAAGDLPAAVRNDPDPLITPPLYGRWHSLTDRILFAADGSLSPQRENWVHELNLDPRFRVAAGFGTTIVQDGQEGYMDAAWGQVGAVIEANRKIRHGQVARETSWIWYERHLGPIKAAAHERAFIMMAPVQARVLASGFTVRHVVSTSMVPGALLSPPMRRILRPRDHVAARLGFDTPKGPGDLLDRVNRGEVLPAPPKTTPASLPTVENAAETLEPKSVPRFLIGWLRCCPSLRWLIPLALLLLALLVYLLMPVTGMLAALLITALAIGLFLLFSWLLGAIRKADSILPSGMSPEALDGLGSFPDFTIEEPGFGEDGAPPPRTGGTDSEEAGRFKASLADIYVLLDQSARVSKPPDRPRIDIPALTDTIFGAIDPTITIPAYVLGGILIPGRIVLEVGESFKEAMAYPEIDVPMYKPLTEPTVERFLPGIQHLPPNTITLLETNQRFIEAYMVGLNHEFARELLWREYPTDQRGSYFRQFWDVSGVRNTDNLSPEALREKLRDIKPIHKWSKKDKLGDHDNREKPGEKEEEVVLVIRGELLKRYPTAVIYAQRARWQLDKNGKIDPTQERIFETSGNPEDLMLLPLYEAEAAPDIFFRGFDLKASEAKGGTGTGTSLDPGWFFVIKERPGEPRFGLDIERTGELNVWNDLAWPDVFAPADGFLKIPGAMPTKELKAPTGDDLAEKGVQYEEDKKLKWHAGTNSAELAYILYQAPMMVAVHGSVMLPD
ncbi:MAG TPA: hypothetical protein VEW26_05725 [Allosphingosinicella sp.]|nr:hypothetical protein [Allosphingosinicella sp.]